MAQHSAAMKERLLDDPCRSLWIKNAMFELDQRDICDVISDLEALAVVYRQQWSEIKAEFAKLRRNLSEVK